MIEEKVFRSLLDGIILDGNRFNVDMIERLHDDIGKPFSGKVIDVDSAKEIITRYFIKYGGVIATDDAS